MTPSYLHFPLSLVAESDPCARKGREEHKGRLLAMGFGRTSCPLRLSAYRSIEGLGHIDALHMCILVVCDVCYNRGTLLRGKAAFSAQRVDLLFPVLISFSLYTCDDGAAADDAAHWHVIALAGQRRERRLQLRMGLFVSHAQTLRQMLRALCQVMA